MRQILDLTSDQQCTTRQSRSGTRQVAGGNDAIAKAAIKASVGVDYHAHIMANKVCADLAERGLLVDSEKHESAAA